MSDSDVVVVLVAHRFGWKPLEPPGDGSKSVTWLECGHALSQGKEVLAFLVDEDYPWPPKHVQPDEHRLGEFKQWLGNRRFRELFTTPEDLPGKVEGALREWRGSGVPAEDDPGKYLESLRQEIAFIDIRGLQVGVGKAYRFSIEDL